MSKEAIDWWYALSEEEQREHMSFYYPDRKFEKIKDSHTCIQRIYIHVKPK